MIEMEAVHSTTWQASMSLGRSGPAIVGLGTPQCTVAVTASFQICEDI